MMAAILIVDDEPHVRLLIERILEPLEDEGAELHFAEDGEEALRVAREVRPQLVFLDVMMPCKDGVAVCRELRSDPALAGVRVVILTAMGQEADRERAEAAGADVYLTKPFNPLQVEALARETLNMP
ncbi:MAG: response regulator [Desulfovibrionaceae bacterium]|nr:response regulator [Desulfovibrionaceae bacterium]